jgi:hypothetical protein
MAAITTDTEWTETLSPGSYDIWVVERGTAYIRRSDNTNHDIEEAALITRYAQRFTIKAGDTGYLYGGAVKVMAYAVE